MAINLARLYIPFILLIAIIEATDIDYNETSSSEQRQSRATGRIVKLYSGTRPEPIVCTGEGFQKDPNNCAVFYRCMKSGNGKYTVFRFQCGPGTVYDPEIEVCNHPRSTKRSECNGFFAPVVDTTHINEIENMHAEVPSPIVTNRPIYPTSTSPAKTSTTTTAKPLLSSDSAYTTTKRSNTIPSSSPYPWGSPINNIYLDNDATAYPSKLTTVTTRPLTPSSQAIFTTTPSIIANVSHSPSRDNICTSDGFMGDSENCRKFYRCVANQRGGYTRYEFSCTETTIWDDDNQICNHAWAVKRSRCGYRNDKITISNTLSNVEKTQFPEKEMNTTIQQQLQISYGSKVTQTQTQISNGSAIQNQTQIHYGDRIDKVKNGKSQQNQTQVSHGSATSQSQTQIDYGNNGVQTQLQIDHSNKASQSQVQISESSTKTAPTTKVTTNAHKGNECTEFGYMGDANDCQKFYRCVDNGRGGYTKYEFKCSDGTAWDQNIQACNHAWAVKECSTKTPSASTTNISATSTHKTTLSYMTSTSTENSQITPQSEDTEDIEDNGYQKPEQVPSSSSTSTSTTIKSTSIDDSKLGNDCTTSGFMGDDKDCKKFYRCVENGRGGFVKHEFKCGEGTVWDAEIEACNHAWAVKECGGSTSPNIPKPETTTKKPAMSSAVPTSSSIVTQSTTPVQHYPIIPEPDTEEDSGYQKPEEMSTSSSTSTTVTPIPIDSSNGTECTSSGFMGDVDDCKIFYRCVENGNGGYIKYEFKCGEGTVWDPEIEACNHAWAVNKCGGNTSPDITEIETTTKNIITSSISSTIATHSTTQIISTTDDGDDHDAGYGPSQNVIATTSTPTKRPQDINHQNVCKTSGFVGDKYNCKKFYRCVEKGDGSFTKYEYLCGEGTLWDQEIEACNHAWAVTTCESNMASSSKQPETTPEYNPPIMDEIDVGFSSPSSTGTDNISQTSSTTEASKESGQSVVCINSGFIGDKNDCKKFYRCVDDGKGGFVRYEFNCGEGTVWDQSIEACNHAWAVKECGAVGNTTTKKPPESTITATATTITSSSQKYPQATEPSSNADKESVVCSEEGYIGDKNNCRIFYRCVNDGKGSFTKYEFTCSQGTYWNQEILSCDYVTSDMECGVTSVYTTSKAPQYEHDETYTETTTLSKDENHVTQKPPVSSGTCTSEGFYGDPNDCKKFYRCVDNGQGGYTKYDFICGDGSVWDQELQTCNHESDKCPSSSSNLPQTTENHVPQDVTTLRTTTERKETSSITSSSTSNNLSCDSEGFFADPSDCQRFIRCVKDDKGGYMKYQFTCGEGTIWVQEILACDHDTGEAECSSQVVTKPLTSPDHQQTTEKYTPSTTDHVSGSEQDNNNSNLESSSGNNDCTSEGYYGNKNNCKQFYRCVDNGKGGYTKYEFTCSEGTAWDSSIQACNHINEVPSCQESILHDEGETQTTQTSASSSQTSSTSSSTSSTTQKTTDASNPTSESTSQNLQDSDSCNSEGYFGNTQDCKKFYRCVDNGNGGYTKYDFNCAEGTIWDQDITTCNHPQNVVNPSCNSTNDSSTSEGSTSDNSTSGGSTSSTTENNTNGQSPDSSSKKPDNTQVNCTEAGYYPNPNDCKKFYRCVDWDGDGTRFSVYHFECGEGTIWDPALDTCNHEESVYPPRNCSGSQSQGESQPSTTEGTTTTQLETTSEQTTTEPTNQPSSSSESTTSTTTEQSGENTTEKPAESTTEQSGESTTEKQAASTTEQTTAGTTEQTGEGTTEKTSEGTTEQSSEGTTEKVGESTTEKSSEATTEKAGESTTEQSSEGTTEKASESTTEQSSEGTTEKTGESTTEKSTEGTTEYGGQSTTENSVESTTQQTTEGTSTTEQTEGTTSEQTEGTTQQGSTTESTTTESSTTESSSEKLTTEQSTTQESTTADNETETSTNENSASKECPQTEGDENLFVCPSSFRRHPKYCNLFYQCDENEESHDLKIAVFTCPNGTIYDESKTKCVQESKAEKQCDGEIAQKRRIKRRNREDENDPIVVSKDSYACPAVGYYAFEKDGNCSPGFLKCKTNKSKKLRGFVYQCPEGYLFWSVSRRCERIDRVKDCKRSVLNSWHKRWEIPIEKKNVAWS